MKDSLESFPHYVGGDRLEELLPLVQDFEKRYKDWMKARVDHSQYVVLRHFSKLPEKKSIKEELVEKASLERTNELLRSELMHWLVRTEGYREAEKIILRKEVLHKTYGRNDVGVIFRFMIDIGGIISFLVNLKLNEDAKNQIICLKEALKYNTNDNSLRLYLESKSQQFKNDLIDIHSRNRKSLFRDVFAETILIYLFDRFIDMNARHAAKITLSLTKMIFKTERETRIRYLIHKANQIKGGNLNQSYFDNPMMTYPY